jgi:hypothetical protein
MRMPALPTPKTIIERRGNPLAAAFFDKLLADIGGVAAGSDIEIRGSTVP